MRKALLLILLTFLTVFCPLVMLAQQHYKVKGTVLDDLQKGIPGASIHLVVGKDTLSGVTDSLGTYSFGSLKTAEISLHIKSIGFQPYSKNYLLKERGTEQVLPAVTLASVAHQLKEVIIEAKTVAMRLKGDTVEYNAGSYVVREGDRIEDLLKQLPGMAVDKNGEVSIAGKKMTKIRVNGKDFFTGNVKEFIAQLPADMVDKLQVIDDYGDNANFTGIKTGEPQKMLNVVTKGKINKGEFGNVLASGGTDQRYGVNLNANIWRDIQQIGLTASSTNTNNGAGISNNLNSGFNYRNKFSKYLTISGNYNYGHSKNESVRQDYTQTVNSLGTLFTQSESESQSRNDTHRFDLGIQSFSEKNFLLGAIRGSFTEGVNQSFNSSAQTGVILQDLQTGNRRVQQFPNVNASFTNSRRFDKKGRNLTLSLDLGNSAPGTDNQLNNKIRYYDQSTGLPVKDSLLNQMINSRSKVQSVNSSVSFTEPLGKNTDSDAHKSIDISYQFSLTHNHNRLITSDDNGKGILKRVDSLSNEYTYSFITHRIGLNYRYTAKKLRYSIGINAQPYLLGGAYEGRTDQVNRTGFNISPIAFLSYNRKDQTYTFYYNGNSMAPDFSQLQPVRDTRNLQNVVIGNPDLKASFNHTASLSYRTVNRKTNNSLQLNINATLTQDQVATNTVLIRDTLNTLKQETRYLNTNGNYNIASTYSYTMPFAKNKYSLEFKGGVSYSQQVSFADNLKNYGKGLNFNQELSGQMNKEWLSLTANVSYSYMNNAYSLPQSIPNTISSWLFSADSKFIVIKSLNIGVRTSKAVNSGYSVANTNPLLITSYVEKSFFKGKKALLRLSGNDLLNQGNNLNRIVSGNSITESRVNQVTRYFLLSFNWRLESFKKMK